MFSTKLFNQITFAVAIIFFLSATISTISDIMQEKNIRMEFSELLQDVNVFNNEHASFLNQEPVTEQPQVPDDVEFQNAKEALVAGYSNYKNASSYYSEAYGRLNFSALNFPFEVDLWIKNIQYEDGDFVQEVIAKEVGTLFGGKMGGMIIYYNITKNVVYRNFTWNVTKIHNKWVPLFEGVWSTQPINSYISEFGALPGTPIYEVTNRTAAEELYYQKVKGVGNKTVEHHIQYKLNPTLSTRLYMGFISYVLNIVEKDFVKSLSFKELTVSAIIDSKGNLSMTKYREKFGFTVHVRQWGGINISATCNSEMTYLYTLCNHTIPYEKPNV